LCPRTIYANNDNFVEMPDSFIETEKTALASMIYSDKAIVSGHQFRHEIAEQQKGNLDFFGKGTGRFLKEKSDSLLPYMYQVVIENGKYPEYVSEKFFDCIKTRTIPIYWGGEEAVRKMGFDMRGVVLFDDLNDLDFILQKLSSDDYQKALPFVKKNWERLTEIRNEDKLLMALHTFKIGYHNTIESYNAINRKKLNVKF